MTPLDQLSRPKHWLLNVSAEHMLKEVFPGVFVIALGIWGIQPFGFGSDYWSAVIVMAGIYMLLAMGLNVVVGYAGLLDLGYAGFWGVGSYATALATTATPFSVFHISFWAAIPIAIAASVTSGILLGLVTLRIRGDYLAIVTLGFGEIVRITANSWDSLTNGPAGITNIPHPQFFGFNFGLDPRPYVILTWLFIGLLYFLISNLWHSRIGRAWYATRQDENAAEILGVPTFRMKLFAFAIGASTAGFAGALYSSYVGYIVPTNFTLLTAIMVMAAVVLGGMSNSKGAMIGAAMVIFLPEVFRGFEQGRFLVFGAVLISVMTLRPAGLFPLRPKTYRLPGFDSEATPHLAATRLDLIRKATKIPPTGVPLLECAGIVKRFGGLIATNDVSLAVTSGSIVAVIGPNGAGKSTLFDLISGATQPNRGNIRFCGRAINGLKPHQIAALGMARTFQMIRLFPAVSVTENILVGSDVRNQASGIAHALRLPSARRNESAMLEIVSGVLEFCGIEKLAGMTAGSLSFGDQRRVEIARALASQPTLLLLDEPAAGMNPTERRRLIELIRKVRDAGVTVLIIEHDVSLIMSLCDEVIVLDHGTVIAKGPPAKVQHDPAVIAAYLGTGEGAPSGPSYASSLVPALESTPLLSVRNLKVGYGPIEVVHGIDFDVHHGEIISIVGANGAGKTSTLLAVSGVNRASEGSIVFDGERIDRWPAYRIAQLGIAHVPEGRRIFQRMSVYDNLAMGTYATTGAPTKDDLDYVFDLFPILKERANQPGGTLSGGEQQMLAMARALVSRPRLLLLDEPSMGLAPQMVAHIFDLIATINHAGVTMILVEQNAHMALLVSQTTYVMETGEIRLSGRSCELADNPEVQAAYLGG